MPFTLNQKPDWQDPGVEPPAEKKTAGWSAGERPPAGFFDWFFYVTSRAIDAVEAHINEAVGTFESLKARLDSGDTALSEHKTTAELDHPDNSVTDNKIGSRTVDQTKAPTGNTGTLGNILSWLANRIKAITGKTNWYDAPDITLAATKTHNHDGTTTPNVPWTNVSGKPATYPPSSHQHAGGDITTAVASATNSDKLDGVDATAFAENVATVSSKRAGYAVYAP